MLLDGGKWDGMTQVPDIHLGWEGGGGGGGGIHLKVLL